MVHKREYTAHTKKKTQPKQNHTKINNQTPHTHPQKDKFLANIRLKNLFQSSFLFRYHCAHKNCSTYDCLF